MYKVTTSTGLSVQCAELYRATEIAEKLFRIAGELGVPLSVSVESPDDKTILTMSRMQTPCQCLKGGCANG